MYQLREHGAFDPQTEGSFYREAQELCHFSQENTRYADCGRILQTDCPNALKAWAAERLPTLGISYGFSNRLTKSDIAANLDKNASLRLIQMADDLALITRFCRHIKSLKIESAPHQNGLEFLFRFSGWAMDERMRDVEKHATEALLQSAWKENSLKIRILRTSEGVELQAIVLRPKMRLGFSPVD